MLPVEGTFYFSEYMKKNQYILVAVGILTLLMLCVLGNIITVGDKLMGVSPIIGSFFYIIICVMVFFLILQPMLQVMMAPEIGDGQCIMEETKMALKQQVRDSAKVSLLMTTVSQNGSIDIIANTAITFKMIGALVKQAGYRPTLPQLFKLYSSVITTSFIVASVDEVIDNLDISGMLGNAGVGAVCKIFQPLANGAANAYMCLRVGYATVRYLECGHKEYNRSKSLIRKEVAREARKDLIPVFKAEVKDVLNKTQGEH